VRFNEGAKELAGEGPMGCWWRVGRTPLKLLKVGGCQIHAEYGGPM